MYEKLIIGLLLLGCISTSIASTTPMSGTEKPATGDLSTKATSVAAQDTPKPRQIEVFVTRDQVISGGEEKGSRKQLEHPFSEPVIIAIVLGVMAGIIGLILLFAVCISKLSKKLSVNTQPSLSHDTEPPLTSVETEHPE